MLPGPHGALQCALGLYKSILRCSWKHLQLWRCIQDATRLTIRIVIFWSCWDPCAGVRKTSRAAKMSAQVYRRLQEHLRPPHRLHGKLGARFSQQWFLGFHNNKACCLLYPSLLQSQDSLHHNMACIIWVSLYIHKQRYRDNRDGLSDREYIFVRLWGR